MSSQPTTLARRGASPVPGSSSPSLRVRELGRGGLDGVRSSRLTAIRGVLLGALVSSTGLAVEEPMPAAERSPGAANAEAVDSAVRDCREQAARDAGASRLERLGAEFDCLFERGAYGQCVPVLEEACTLTDSPRCLLNLGIVHHALLHCELARSYYERYVAAAPRDEGRAAAEAALEELYGICGRGEADAGGAASTGVVSAPSSTPSSSAPPSGPSPASLSPSGPSPTGPSPAAAFAPARSASSDAAAASPRTTPHAEEASAVVQGAATLDSASSGWAELSHRVVVGSLLVAGVTGAATSAYYAGKAASSERTLESLARDSGGVLSLDDPRARAIDREGRRNEGRSRAFGVASVLLIGAGVTFWIWRPHDDAGVSVSGGASLDVRYRVAF